MGVRILENADDGMAVLYDSVTMTAFGPVFYDWDPDGQSPTAFAGEVAEAFLDWLGCDARERRADEIRSDYAAFMAALEADGWDAVVGEEVTT